MDSADLAAFFAPFGPVVIKRMFGGHGIYADGICFAIHLRGEVMLRGDAAAGPRFEAAGGKRWVYQRQSGPKGAMPYWSVPESAFDEPSELIAWCEMALGAARRAASTKTVAGAKALLNTKKSRNSAQTRDQ